MEPGEAGVEANGTKGRSLRWVVPGGSRGGGLRGLGAEPEVGGTWGGGSQSFEAAGARKSPKVGGA